MPFDPSKFGATPAQSTFDPASFGATKTAPATPQVNHLNGFSTIDSKPFAEPKVFGNDPGGGVFQNITKTTIGSEGIGGLGGKPVVSAMTAGAEKPVADASAQLASVNDALIKKIRSLPAGDPKRDSLLEVVKENQKAFGISNDVMSGLEGVQETQKQNAGNVLNSEGTIASIMASPATFAQKMLAATGIGAAYGAAQPAEKNSSATDIAKGAVAGGATGAATQGVMSGVTALAKKAVSELPEALLTKKLGFTPKQIQQGAHEDVVKTILDNKKVGSVTGLMNDAEQAVSDLNGKVDSALQSHPASYTGGNQISNKQVAEITAQRLRDMGWTATPEDILASVKTFVGKGQGSHYLESDLNNVVGANELRKGVDAATKPSDFLRSQHQVDTTLAMEFANTMRSAVKAVAPETRPMFDEMSKNIALRDAMNVAASKGHKLGGMMDILSAVLGAIPGTLTGNPALGALGGIAAERAATSMPATTATAVGLHELAKTAPYLSKLSVPMRLFLMSTLGHAAGDSQTTKPEAPPTQ